MNKIFSEKKYLIAGVVFGIVFFFLPFSAKAATTVYFDAREPGIYEGDTFLINLKISTPEKSINVVDGTILYDKSKLEIKEASAGNSIFGLWPKPPVFSNERGTLSFVGGTPGGFQNKGGEILKIVFLAKSEGGAKIDFLDGFSVFLNDGKGTQINPWLRPFSLNILTRPPEIPVKDEWQDLLKSDKNPPEPFKIDLGKNPGIFNNQYFISFFTVDKESGIDRYEIQEGTEPYIIGDSPYLLKNQKLGTLIKVKAVDKSGNEQVAELVTAYPSRFYQTLGFWMVIILAVIIILIFVKIKAAKKKSIRR